MKDEVACIAGFRDAKLPLALRGSDFRVSPVDHLLGPERDRNITPSMWTRRTACRESDFRVSPKNYRLGPEREGNPIPNNMFPDVSRPSGIIIPRFFRGGGSPGMEESSIMAPRTRNAKLPKC